MANQSLIWEDEFTGEKYNVADRPIEVCHSAAGYYVGQTEPSGTPLSRLSENYFKTEAAAERAISEGFRINFSLENEEIIYALQDAGHLVKGD